MEAPDPAPSTITIGAWLDPTVDERGHHVSSLYVEVFWLPVLGPSATLLLRRCALLTNRRPHGSTVALELLSASLGLGKGVSRNAPLPRAIDRCIRFGAARRVADDRLAVRRMLGPLSQQHMSRLHPKLQDLHANWDTGALQGDASFESV
jgi:hypothetical protein